MKYFVLSDPHSFTSIMKQALADAGFDKLNPNHKLIICGDCYDRGKEPVEMLKFLQEMISLDKLILVKGNHEDLLVDYYYNEYKKGYYPSSHHIHNGTVETVNIMGDKYIEEALDIIFNNTVDFFETEHYIFVHGWIPTGTKLVEPDKDSALYSMSKEFWQEDLCYKENWREADKTEWEEARWLNGMAQWRNEIIEPDKNIVCGHYHASWGNAHLHNDGKEFLSKFETFYIDPDTGKQEPHENHNPFIDDGIIAIDACTAHSHQVNVVVLED